jgi:hypothetical protein
MWAGLIKQIRDKLEVGRTYIGKNALRTYKGVEDLAPGRFFRSRFPMFRAKLIGDLHSAATPNRNSGIAAIFYHALLHRTMGDPCFK